MRSKLLKKYARKEPSRDPILRKYVPLAYATEVRVYNDLRAKNLYAIFPWGMWKPRKGAREATINCYRWKLIWLPDLKRIPKEKGVLAHAKEQA
ncbi:MAG: hypothetical protein HS116_21120 [Planctomycetes bacterium]|nr:hypothetical protein [Planctomycetota bacterium]